MTDQQLIDALGRIELDEVSDRQYQADKQALKEAAERIADLPGLHPQRRPADCTRHGYHLFMLRLDESAFGAPRAAVLRALAAEGIPCSGGYGFSLPHQPLFRNKAFGPYLAGASARLDYREARCPASDLLCREQCVWLEQHLLLGSQNDVDDIARGFEKVYAHRDALNRAGLSLQ